MINKLKIGLLVAVLSLAVGVGSAYAINLTYSDYTDLSIGGYTLTIYPTSYATSLVTKSTTVDIVVPTGSTFTIASHNNMTVSATGTDTSVNTCAASTNKLVITGLDGNTYTLTPGSGVCSTGGGGGGGGGGGYVAPVITVVTTPSVIAGCIGTTGFSTTSGASCSGSTTTTVTTTTTTPTSTTVITTTYNLGTTTLKNGSRGTAVKELQKLLNKILKLGLAEDGKLGPKTIAVIKKWQKDHGLKVDGLVGPKTKAAMKAEAQ